MRPARALRDRVVSAVNEVETTSDGDAGPTPYGDWDVEVGVSDPGSRLVRSPSDGNGVGAIVVCVLAGVVWAD